MLQLQGVDAGYGRTTVLRDVSITVPAATVCALIGPNGAGKTTLLRLASGLIQANRGRLLLDGDDVLGCTPDELAARGLCHIPEGRGVFRSLTVHENLILFALPDAGREGIERAVEAFPRLRERMNQTAGTLSGGEQQMLALARAYCSGARVVLLDEVSMGLAPLVVDEIFNFLRELAADGVALLLVEQYVTRALEAAQYVYILDRGQIRFSGEPSELTGEEVIESYLGSGATR